MPATCSGAVAVNEFCVSNTPPQVVGYPPYGMPGAPVMFAMPYGGFPDPNRMEGKGKGKNKGVASTDGVVNRVKAQMASMSAGRLLAVLRHGCARLVDSNPQFLNQLVEGLTHGECREVDPSRIARAGSEASGSGGGSMTRKEAASFLAAQIAKWKEACHDDDDVRAGDLIISEIREEHGRGISVDDVPTPRRPKTSCSESPFSPRALQALGPKALSGQKYSPLSL